MPTSDFHQISDVLHVLEQVNPERILDVGIGFGKWGILCREVLEIYYERYQRESWIKRVDGIEIFEPYRNPLWGVAYDEIYMGDAFDVLDRLEPYDLILVCDVLEHFDKERGWAFLDKCLSRGKVVIITSPRGHAPQGAVHGNEHETHRSEWTEADFRAFHHRYKNLGSTFMVVVSASEENLVRVKVQNPFDILGIKRGALEYLRFSMARLRRKR